MVVEVLHQSISFLWRGVRPMHFVINAFSNYAEVLHSVTPIDFDMCTVSNGCNICISQKVTPLDLLAPVAGSPGDNRWFYLTG